MSVLGVVAGMAASLLLNLFLVWAVLYFYVDGSELENPGTDPEASMAIIPLAFVVSCMFSVVGGILIARLVFRRRADSEAEQRCGNLQPK